MVGQLGRIELFAVVMQKSVDFAVSILALFFNSADLNYCNEMIS